MAIEALCPPLTGFDLSGVASRKHSHTAGETEAGVQGALKVSLGEAPAFWASMRSIKTPKCTGRNSKPKGAACGWFVSPPGGLLALGSGDHCDQP